MLRIYDVILDVVRELRPELVRMHQRDPAFARQFRRALTSVPLHVAEAASSRGANRADESSRAPSVHSTLGALRSLPVARPACVSEVASPFERTAVAATVACTRGHRLGADRLHQSARAKVIGADHESSSGPTTEAGTASTRPRTRSARRASASVATGSASLTTGTESTRTGAASLTSGTTVLSRHSHERAQAQARAEAQAQAQAQMPTRPWLASASTPSAASSSPLSASPKGFVRPSVPRTSVRGQIKW
jgi:hypothetical protein